MNSFFSSSLSLSLSIYLSIYLSISFSTPYIFPSSPHTFFSPLIPFFQHQLLYSHFMHQFLFMSAFYSSIYIFMLLLNIYLRSLALAVPPSVFLLLKFFIPFVISSLFTFIPSTPPLYLHVMSSSSISQFFSPLPCLIFRPFPVSLAKVVCLWSSRRP